MSLVMLMMKKLLGYLMKKSCKTQIKKKLKIEKIIKKKGVCQMERL